MTADFEAVIGLEIHAQTLTQSKIFCGCSTAFGGEPNTNICPVCVGLPGVLPVLNRKVVELAIKTGLALGCRIAPHTIFARKNYFYPDLPKAYQISQYEQPIAEHGALPIALNGETKPIGITRVHMEEDAGKLVHQGSATIHGATHSLVDFNRSGVPLLEIVSEPDLRSPEEAKQYVMTLRSILQYLGVCDGNMEEGSLRCDANISLRRKGETTLGTKTEVKNMNSFRSVERAIAHEIKRQEEILLSGGRVVQETRLYSDAKGETFSMRSKESAHDYRYFPEPDLVPMAPAADWIEAIRASLPELPPAKIKRYQDRLGLPLADATLLVQDQAMVTFFEACLPLWQDPKTIANWLLGEVLAYLNEHKTTLGKTSLTPEKLIAIFQLIEKGTLSGKLAKSVLVDVMQTGKQAEEIVREQGLTQIDDVGALEKVIQTVLANNPKAVSEYRGGKKQTIGFLVGQVMKATQGRGKPATVNDLLRKALEQ